MGRRTTNEQGVSLMGYEYRLVHRPYYQEVLDMIGAHPAGVLTMDIRKAYPELSPQHIGAICRSLCWSGVITCRREVVNGYTTRRWTLK